MVFFALLTYFKPSKLSFEKIEGLFDHVMYMTVLYTSCRSLSEFLTYKETFITKNIFALNYKEIHSIRMLQQDVFDDE